jgi:hypothetical protein
MIDFIKRLFSRYGFHRQPPVHHHSGSSVGPVVSSADIWWEHDFHTEQQRKTERLAAIARERDALKDQLAKAIRQKTKRSGIYAQIKALKTEELAIEQGKETGK